MDGAPRTSSATAAWDALARELDGSFVARARGILGSRFSLSDDGGREWGQLRMLGSYAAEIHAGETVSEIERTGEFGNRYRMRTGKTSVLVAGPERPREGIRIFCAGSVYEAETSVLRNTSVARRLITGAEGGPTEDGVRLAGGLAGRSYQATFPKGEGGASLAVALFLLYRNVSIRRTAF